MPGSIDKGPGLSIAVVGTGALGSALLKQIAVHGFRSVLMVDPDKVEPTNLPLSPFLACALEANATGDAQMPGFNKAEQLAAGASRLYRLPWRACPSEIADVGWQDLQAADLICCCTDSALSRAETSYVARMLGKPVLDGAVFGAGIREGRVSMFFSEPDAACYLCGMSESSRATVLGYAASASLGCRPLDEVPAMTGTVETLERIAAKMVEALLKFSLTRTANMPSSAVKTSLMSEADTSGATTWRDEPIKLLRSATCPWHDGLPSRLVPLPWEVPLRDSLRLFPDISPSVELQLAWPICTEAVCGACRQRSRPFLRVAAVRRGAACVYCGLPELQPVRSVHRIRPGGELGSISPRQLGLPDRHLYWLRDTADMNEAVQKDTP